MEYCYKQPIKQVKGRGVEYRFLVVQTVVRSIEQCIYFELAFGASPFAAPSSLATKTAR
jgi:hypothetical protein